MKSLYTSCPKCNFKVSLAIQLLSSPPQLECQQCHTISPVPPSPAPQASETPLTNMNARQGGFGITVVNADFARTLELKLAAATAEVERLSYCIDRITRLNKGIFADLRECIAELEKENATLREKAEAMATAFSESQIRKFHNAVADAFDDHSLSKSKRGSEQVWAMQNEWKKVRADYRATFPATDQKEEV